MDSEKKRNKILLYYNAYSGSGIFRKRLDRIIDGKLKMYFQDALHPLVPTTVQN